MLARRVRAGRLGHTQRGMLKTTADHHSCPEVLPNEAKQPFVPHPPRHPVHQHIVVDRIEELGQVQIYGSAVCFSIYSLTFLTAPSAERPGRNP